MVNEPVVTPFFKMGLQQNMQSELNMLMNIGKQCPINISKTNQIVLYRNTRSPSSSSALHSV